MRVAIGNDHAGFKLKQAIINYLKEQNIDFVDCGTDSSGSVDYPDFGVAVARKVAGGECERGILICGSGIGMSMVANKIKGIRAALCMTPEHAGLSRKHNDANILVLAGRYIDPETAREMAHRWFSTEFEGGRHARRVQKIHDLTGM